MKKYFFAIVITLFSQFIYAQTDSVIIEKVTKTGLNYKSFQVVGERLFSLSENGKLIIWDLKHFDIIPFYDLDTNLHFSSLGKGSQNNIYLGTENGKIIQINPDNLTCSEFLTLKKKIPVKGIFFNSENNVFLIVPNAVYDPVSKKYWDKFIHQPNGLIVKKSIGLFQKQTNKYFNMPQYSFMDCEDRLWMTNSFGEFGGGLQIFDSKKRKIISSKIDSINFGLFSPKSVFEDNNCNIYITSGLQHFLNSGEIYKINNRMKAVKIFNSDDYEGSANSNLFKNGVFVGPGAYNPAENKIYFATNIGFFKADLPDNGKIRNIEFVFAPKLRWENEALAIGVAMTIKRLEFTTDNRLVFLTANDGIGVFSGNKLIMLK